MAVIQSSLPNGDSGIGQKGKLGTQVRHVIHARKRVLFVSILVSILIFLYLWKSTTVFHPVLIRPGPFRYVPKESSITDKIWQILLPMPKTVKAKPASFAEPSDWMEKNPGYTYTLFGMEGAESFLKLHYGDRPEILKTFQDLQNPALKSDFLRYLVLLAEGGVYSDLDTRPIRPIDEWVPEKYRSKVKLIAGIEFDVLDSGNMQTYIHPVQFAQWTIAAAPGHEIMSNMVEKCLSELREMSHAYNTTIANLHMKDLEVLNVTGPVAWTEMVFQGIQKQVPELVDLTDLSGMKEPTLYGDVLILPIDGFTAGVPHSGSTTWYIPEEALIMHHSSSSWRVDNRT